MDIVVHPRGYVTWLGDAASCVLGRGGIRRDKREGDGATPVGRFPLRRVLWRADRLAKPETSLLCSPIESDDGWCDDPADPASLPANLLYTMHIDGHNRIWVAGAASVQVKLLVPLIVNTTFVALLNAIDADCPALLQPMPVTFVAPTPRSW